MEPSLVERLFLFGWQRPCSSLGFAMPLDHARYAFGARLGNVHFVSHQNNFHLDVLAAHYVATCYKACSMYISQCDIRKSLVKRSMSCRSTAAGTCSPRKISQVTPGMLLTMAMAAGSHTSQSSFTDSLQYTTQPGPRHRHLSLSHESLHRGCEALRGDRLPSQASDSLPLYKSACCSEARELRDITICLLNWKCSGGGLYMSLPLRAWTAQCATGQGAQVHPQARSFPEQQTDPIKDPRKSFVAGWRRTSAKTVTFVYRERMVSHASYLGFTHAVEGKHGLPAVLRRSL